MLQRALTDLFPARRTLGTAVLDPGFDVALDRARDLLGATSASLSDAPDVDFANLLARNDHAIVGLASALCRASPESALAALAGTIAGARRRRQARLRAWMASDAPARCLVLDGSGTIFRHVRVRQADETARAVRDTPERAFAALAVMAYRRDVDLARFELELGRDREMRALAAAVSATTIGEIADLAGHPRATSATAVPPQTASPPSALAHAA